MNLLKIATPLVGLAMFGAACTDSDTEENEAPSNPTQTTVETVPFQFNEPTTTTTLPSRVPDIADFSIGLYLVSSECFGSAGGLLEVEPEVAYDGPGFDGSWELRYQINGDEDGPIVDTIDVNEDGSYTYWSQIVSTPTCGTEPTASILSLREQPQRI